MQPVSGSGTPTPGDRATSTSTSAPSATTTANSAAANSALTTTQRATLETLVVKLQALTSLSSSAIWNNVHQDLGLATNQALSAQYFSAAERSLQAQVSQAQAQHSAERQPLLQRITELLPQGNNSQLVSQFLRQEFGHSALNALTQPQLQRVLDLLQNAPGVSTNSAASALANAQTQNPLDTLSSTAAAAALLQRPLSSAEQSGLNQMVTRLSALLGEQPGKLWSSLMSMQQLAPGTPIPARNLSLLTQYLQTQTDLHHLLASGKTSNSASGAPSSAMQPNTAVNLPPTATLAMLQPLIQPRLAENERQLLQDYSQARFNVGLQAPLTQIQLNDVVTFLFAQRLQREQTHPLAGQNLFPQPLVNPLIAALPPGWQALFHKPMFWPIVGTCVVLFLLWVLI